MADKTLNARIKQKYDIATNWTSNNPILLAGEIGVESDTNKMKVGDGTNAWNSLSYISGNDIDLSPLENRVSAVELSLDSIINSDYFEVSRWHEMEIPSKGSGHNGTEGIVYAKDMFVISPANSNVVLYSKDGIDWETSTVPTSAFYYITYGAGKFVMIAGGINVKNNIVVYSDDAINWTEVTLSESADWSSITYGNGLFVAISAYSQKSAYSSDGINWTIVDMPSTTGAYYSIAYGNNKFVAIANSGYILAYSLDGTSWTYWTWEGSASLCPTGRTIIYEKDKFIVSGGTNKIWYSYDGDSWDYTTVSGAYWTLIYGNDMFVAVTTSGETLYSKDGIEWGIGTNLPSLSNYWRFGAFGSNRFIVGTYNRNVETNYIAYMKINAEVPTKISQLINDSGFITGYIETDPTVPAWAKEATKPTYDYSEITNTPTNTVTIDTAQTITGQKTFTSDITNIKSQTIDNSITPTSNQYQYFDFLDINDNRLGVVGSTLRTDGYYGTYLQGGNENSIGVFSTGSDNFIGLNGKRVAFNGETIITQSTAYNTILKGRLSSPTTARLSSLNLDHEYFSSSSSGRPIVRFDVSTQDITDNTYPTIVSADGSTTTRRDGYVVTFMWDNSGIHDSQLFVPNSNDVLRHRYHNSSGWSDWGAIPKLVEEPYWSSNEGGFIVNMGRFKYMETWQRVSQSFSDNTEYSFSLPNNMTFGNTNWNISVSASGYTDCAWLNGYVTGNNTFALKSQRYSNSSNTLTVYIKCCGWKS